MPFLFMVRKRCDEGRTLTALLDLNARGQRAKLPVEVMLTNFYIDHIKAVGARLDIAHLEYSQARFISDSLKPLRAAVGMGPVYDHGRPDRVIPILVVDPHGARDRALALDLVSIQINVCDAGDRFWRRGRQRRLAGGGNGHPHTQKARVEVIDPFDRNAQLIVPGPGHRSKHAVGNFSIAVDVEDGFWILADRAGPLGVDITLIGDPAADRVGLSDRVEHVVGRGIGQATNRTAEVYPNAAEMVEAL